MRRPCGLRRHACTMTKSPRAVATITTTPPPRPSGRQCDAAATMVRLPLPPRRCRYQRAAPTTERPAHQCIERAAPPRRTLHLCIVRAYGPDGRRMRRPCGLRRHACTVTKSPRAVATITTTPPSRHVPHQCIPRRSQHGNALRHRTRCPITARPHPCGVGPLRHALHQWAGRGDACVAHVPCDVAPPR